MDIGLTLVGGIAFLLLGFVLIGGPMIVADWFRKRRQAAVERQIGLTDALDQQFGAIVAPVVRRLLSGSWQIEIAAPYGRPTEMAGMLSVIDGVFSDAAGPNSPSYRIVLRPEPASLRETHRSRTLRPIGPWVRNPAAAARNAML